MAKAKPNRPSRGKLVHCPACGRDYRRSELVRQSKSSPGMKGTGGGPNGSWRVAWLCCPKGHDVGGFERRIS